MIAIAQQHVFEVAFVPLVPIEMIIKLRFLLPPHVECFIHDDETHAVSQLEQFRRWRIVRSAQTVSAHRFQHFKLPFKCASVDGRAERTEIVMIARAANLYGFAIQDEAFVYVKNERADSKRRLISIDDAAVLL